MSTTPPLRIVCLSVRQPWAELIVSGRKLVENRGRATSHRGLLIIQASRLPAEIPARQRAALGIVGGDDLPIGGVVGAVEVHGCIRDGDAHDHGAWFTGPVGWLLRNPRRLPFIPMLGMPGLFTPPADVVEAIRRALR